MGANAEHKINPQAGHEPVRWIGREPALPDTVVPLGPPETSVSDGGGTARAKWIAGAVAAAVLAVVGLILWRGHTADPAVATLATQQAVPLVSVISPGVTSVTSSVTFTGTISARYDMPIGTEGDTGRIVGDLCRGGRSRESGASCSRSSMNPCWQPQVNRLAASLEEAKAQAALSAAEYRRAAGWKPPAHCPRRRSRSAARRRHRRGRGQSGRGAARGVQARLDAHACRRARRRRGADPHRGSRPDRNPGRRALFRLARNGEVEMRGQIAEQDMASPARRTDRAMST